MSADLGAGLFWWVKGVSALTDFIGEGDECRFYPVAVQSQKPLPYIVYEEERDSAVTVHDRAPSLASSRVVFACVAADPTGANLLADALRTALEHFAGQMGPVGVQGVIYEGSSPAYQWEEQQFAVDANYKFWFRL